MKFQSTLLVLLSVGFAMDGGGGQNEKEDFAPEAITPRMFDELLHNSPFTRPLNDPGSMVLTGYCCVNGKPIVFVKETGTGQTHRITDTPNEKGWKLVEVERNANLSHMSAKIAVEGGESMEIRYEESSLNPHGTAVEIKVPTGIDTRPPPTDEERKKFVESITPRFRGMSEWQKKRFGQVFGEKLKANPNLSDRQKGALLLNVLDYVAPQPK